MAKARLAAPSIVFFHADSRPAMPNTILDKKSKPSLTTLVDGYGYKVTRVNGCFPVFFF